MRKRPTLSLFPFLNVLLGIMGVLAFLAVTLPLFGLSTPKTKVLSAPKQKQIAPKVQYSLAYWVECNQQGLVLHGSGQGRGGKGVVVPLGLLRQEAFVLQKVLKRLGDPLEGGPKMEAQRRLVLQQLQRHYRLRRGFTAVMLQLELQNLKALAGKGAVYHPVLAIQPKGLEAYRIAHALLRTATRLRSGLEPMWDARTPPWQAGGKG